MANKKPKYPESTRQLALNLLSEFIQTLGPEKETIPSAGIKKFSVTIDPLKIYTTIGADNEHHAANKATKLFGPGWSGIYDRGPTKKSVYRFVPVTEFRELAKVFRYEGF